MITRIACSLALLAGPLAAQSPAPRQLAGLVGTWQATTVFHSKDGKAPEYHEVGAYTISWVLDSAYLQWSIALRSQDNPGRHRSMLILLTYNRDSARYEQTYFYSGSPLRVFETVTYDPVRRELRTSTLIPREDGVRDEHVRSVTTFEGDTAMVYTHFSRYENEPAEWNDFSATLRRRVTPE